MQTMAIAIKAENISKQYYLSLAAISLVVFDLNDKLPKLLTKLILN